MQMWLPRLVAGGGKLPPCELRGLTPALSTSSITTAVRCLVLRAVSGLDAFSRYPRGAWLLGTALPDNPYTRGADPPFLSYLRDLPLRHQSASTKKQQTCLTTV